MLEDLFDPPGVGGLTSKEHVSHRRKGPRNFLGKLVKQRGRQKHSADLLRTELRGEGLRRQDHVLGHADEACPVQQRSPDFKGGGVKGTV
jgi:hypothetical protein